MSKNLLNYEGLEYFLSKLQTYIENQRTVKNVDTVASNGINLSNTNGTLDVTVTPGSVADGDTGLVTGDAVYDAIQAGKAIEVKLTATANPNQYTASMPPAAIASFINSGKDVYILMPEGATTQIYKAYSGAYSNGNSDIRYYNIYRDYNQNIVVKEIKQVGTDATLTTYTLANLDSPQFTGTPTAPTAASGTNTTQIATTAFVNSAIENNYFIVTGTYNNNVLTADKTAQEVYEAVQAGKQVYLVVNSDQGIDYHQPYQIKYLGGNLYFIIYSALNPIALEPRETNTTTSNKAKVTFIAHSGTTLNKVDFNLANIVSPTFTGEPKAPTADLGTNNTQIATTAFVAQTVANAQIGKAAFQGTVDSQSDIPNVYKKGYHWLVQTAGTYFTQVCEVGDIIYCVADSDATHEASWSIEKDFTVIQNNLDITIISNAEIDSLFTTESSNDSSNNG